MTGRCVLPPAVVRAGARQACLGDADGNATNNVDAYDWDDGSFSPQGKPHRMGATPHVVKVRDRFRSEAGRARVRKE